MNTKWLPLLGQYALATVLTSLWVWWSPPATDCDDPDGDLGIDPFVGTVLEPPPATDRPAVAPAKVEYGRCVMVNQLPAGNPECIYEPGAPLRLWVVHPEAAHVEITVDGQRSSASVYFKPDEPGQGFDVAVASHDAERLSVHVPGEEPWTLPLRSTTRLTDAELANLAAFKRDSRVHEAYLLLGHLERLPPLRTLAMRMLDQGLLSKAVETTLVASYHLTQRLGRPDHAQRLIEQLPDLEIYPRGRAAASIYLGNALLEQGRLIDAAQVYRDGGRYAVRMDDPGLQIDALSMYARVLAELGYFEAAAYWGSRVLPLVREHGDVASRVDVLTTIGKANLQLREAGLAHDDPEPRFREALEVRDHDDHEDRPVDLGELDPARLGLATLAVLDGEPEIGLRHLETIDTAKLTNEQLVDFFDLRLRALLARPKGSETAAVHEALANLELAAAAATSPDVRWRAKVRGGVVLERLGDLSQARAAYEHAETLLDRQLLLARLGLTAQVGPMDHTEGTQRLISVLLAEGHASDALCVARRAQARRSRLSLLFRRLAPRARERLRPLVKAYLEAKHEYEGLMRDHDRLTAEELARAPDEALRRRQSLESRALEILAADPDASGDDPRIECDDLAPRAPGELLLALYPHFGDLLVFIEDDEGLTHWVLPLTGRDAHEGDMDGLASQLLDRLEERLPHAERLRIAAVGFASALSIHALPWRGRPLAVQLPVVYGLELPPASPTASTGSPSRALVLADPRVEDTDLETHAVTQMLRGSGWAVSHEESTSLPAHALRRALTEVEHFHYAGHAHYGGGQPIRHWPPYPGGAAVEPSHILVGAKGRLDVHDVVMMERVPQTVVLMGCNTSVQDERVARGGWSLATGFVAAGSAAVIASTREVDTGEASLVGRGMHAQLARSADPGDWLMHGLRWAQRHGLSDRAVGNYRVLVP
ncbi:MAG: CHAT domain-containing protein [Myxococcota bacterium]